MYMLHIIKLTTFIFFVYFIISCGSSKKEINLEDETAESLLQKSHNALQSQNYNEAIKIDSLLLISFPTSDLHIDAQLNTAKALGGKEQFEDQLDLLLRILRENIVPEKVPQIYLQIAKFYEDAAEWNPGTVTNDSADWAKAAIYYRKAVFYPDSEDDISKAMGLYRAALMYAKLGQIDVARRAYEQTIAFYPDTKYSAMAKIKINDPANTDEVVLGADVIEEISEQATTEEQEIPVTEPLQPDEEVEGTDIKEMIITDTTSVETEPGTEMAPELYVPAEQDTVSQEYEQPIEEAEFDTVESDSTNQGIE